MLGIFWFFELKHFRLPKVQFVRGEGVLVVDSQKMAYQENYGQKDFQKGPKDEGNGIGRMNAGQFVKSN